ncbi:MAG TPA: uroporphyrinogen decarboxylase family protein [Bryobacteraceae bacterium]|nr:uroporphyrinogen decarboxylase family protein [Bryobacteraceae bacterium]
MTGKQRVLAALAGQPVDRLPLMPITMMFAADTAGVSYRAYASHGEVLAQAQLVTAERYGFDYVSAISDPAREASDLGATVEWFDSQPPAIVEGRALLADKAALSRLRLPDPAAPGRMRDRVDAVRLLAASAGETRIVEGWVEGPCAMAADLRGVNTLMLDFYDDPEFVERLVAFVLAMEIRFAQAQIQAGATLIGVGDAAASLIGPKFYERFVLAGECALVRAIHQAGALARLHICGNTRRILRGMGQTGADIVDLDFLSPLEEGRAAMGEAQILLGNIDPVRVLRDGTPESVTAAIAECHRQAGRRYIVGAGCEVPRGTPPGNLMALTRYAREHRE